MKGTNQPNPVSRSFAFPHEVVDDPSLNLREKRAILSEWASDACAVDSLPALRLLPGTSFPVTLSAVMDALAQLDRRYGEDIPVNRGMVIPMPQRGIRPLQPAGL